MSGKEKMQIAGNMEAAFVSGYEGQVRTGRGAAGEHAQVDRLFIHVFFPCSQVSVAAANDPQRARGPPHLAFTST